MTTSRSAVSPVPYLDAETIAATLPWGEAVAALDRALTDGLDPAAGVPRQVIDVASGQLLLMPAESAAGPGVKIVTLAPGNADRGLPRIQGLYLLLDPETLAPAALLDGIAVTNLRTPSVSAVAVDHLAIPDATRLVVFGAGPQARGHVEAVRAVRPIETVTVVGRDPGRAEELAAWGRAEGLAASVGSADAVESADVVVCATTAREPVFDGTLLADHACVVAIGSHEPDVRELDDTVLRRAVDGGRLVVESRPSALRECGEVVMAVEAGLFGEDELVDLGEAVRLDPPSGPGVFKGSGMAWQDLVVAQAIWSRL